MSKGKSYEQKIAELKVFHLYVKEENGVQVFKEDAPPTIRKKFARMLNKFTQTWLPTE